MRGERPIATAIMQPSTKAPSSPAKMRAAVMSTSARSGQLSRMPTVRDTISGTGGNR